MAPALPKLLIVVLGFSLGIGCKSPICRVGSHNGTNEMKRWANIGDQKVGWFQSWQRYEDYRNTQIFINDPDLQLLCEAGCEEFKNEIRRALQDNLINKLKRQPDYKFVTTRNEAEFEIFIVVSKVKEHHPIEYFNYFPPSNYYSYWFKIVSTGTPKTAFWASGIDFFDDASHRRTYDRLIKNFNDFHRAHN